jgi:hypothetical protein
MKKITLCLMTIGLSLVIQPHSLTASVNTTSTAVVAPKHSEPEVTTALLNRLYQIDEMDKSDLRPSEKKKLRAEVRSIKHQLRSSGTAIYISGGAVILIVILLIILL